MSPHTVSPGGNCTRFYYYYRCAKHMKDSYEGCSNYRHYRAEELEEQVWQEVRVLLRDPNRLRAGMDTVSETHRSALRDDPERETRTWLDRLAKIDRKRAKYQEMAAEELISLDELREQLTDLQDIRVAAERELEEVKERAGRIAALERDRDALLSSYEALAVEELDDLALKERHGFYRTLRAVVYAHPEGGVEVTGEFRPFGTPGSDDPSGGAPGSNGPGWDPNEGGTSQGFPISKNTRACAEDATVPRASRGRPRPATPAAHTLSRSPGGCPGLPPATRPVCRGGTLRTCRRSSGRGP
jgi:hypothetical protein